MLLKIFSSFGSRDKVNLIILSFIVVIGSFLEVVSIGLIIPFLAILTGQEGGLLTFLPDDFYIGYKDFFNAEKITYIFIVSIIASNLFRIFTTYYQIYAIKKIGLNFSNRVIANMLRANINALPENTVAEKITSATSKITIFLGNGIRPIVTLLSNTISSIIIFSYLVYLEPGMTIVVTISLISCYSLATITMRRPAQNASKLMDTAQVSVTRALKDMFTGQIEIQAYRTHKWFEENFMQQEDNFRSSLATVQILSQLPRYLIETILISVLAIYIMLNFSVGENDIQGLVGRLGAFVFGMQRLAPMAQGIYASYSTLRGSKQTLETLSDQLNCNEYFEIEYVNADKTKISMASVSCSHMKQGDQIFLSNINVVLESSFVYKISGPSGSGKSSIINLIMGGLKPTKGKVTRCFPAQPKIGYAPQDVTILDGSVKENLLFGRDEIHFEEKELWEALNLVQLSKKIKHLGGLDASVGEMGKNLSGGEKQRLAIARTILTPPDILILDETTSGIDQSTEARILDKLTGIMQDGILIIVSHRDLPESFVDVELKIENNSILMADFK